MPPTFESKTRSELKGIPEPAKPGDTVPSVQLDAFGLDSAAGSALHRVFTYVSRQHSLEELSTPHYFDEIRGFGAKVWDIINVTVGSDPATAVETSFRVTDLGVGRRLPLLVSQGPIHRFGSGNGKAKAA